MNEHVREVVKWFSLVLFVIVICYCYGLKLINDNHKQAKELEEKIADFKAGDTITSDDLKKYFPSIYKDHNDLCMSILSEVFLDYKMPMLPLITEANIDENYKGETFVNIMFIYDVGNDFKTTVKCNNTFNLNTGELYKVSIDCNSTSNSFIESINTHILKNKIINGEDDGTLYKNMMMALASSSTDYIDLDNKDGETVWRVRRNQLHLNNELRDYSIELVKPGDWTTK